MFGSYISLGWIDFSSCLSWHTGNISYLWRKMIFIGHILGQLLIIDLLCCWCCFFGSDLASVLYIWSYLGLCQNKLSLQPELLALRAETTLLCYVQNRAQERAAQIIKDGDELNWLIWILSLDTSGWKAWVVFLIVFFLDSFSDATLHFGIKSYFILLKKCLPIA